MSWIATGVGVVGAGIKIAGGINQTSKANKALKKLNETPFPEYSEDPRLTSAYNRAEAMSSQGFAPEEKAQFQGQLARSQNATRQSAMDLSGGDMGGAINSVLQANQTGAINQFAAKDAGLRRENIQYADTLASQVQSQQNMMQQQKIARRQMLETAYGQAVAQGRENTYGAIGDITNLAVSTL